MGLITTLLLTNALKRRRERRREEREDRRRHCTSCGYFLLLREDWPDADPEMWEDDLGGVCGDCY